MKYFTKEQLCIENQPLLFANGFLHAIRLKERQQAADPERTPLSIGTSTLLSLQAHFTNVREIGSPMASLKFVRGGESPFVYRSADIVQVNLWKPLRIINPDIPTHVTVNPNQPYLQEVPLRPRSLEIDCYGYRAPAYRSLHLDASLELFEISIVLEPSLQQKTIILEMTAF